MKILAVDYGDSRTGLATCDRTEFLTTAITPQITLKARNKVAARGVRSGQGDRSRADCDRPAAEHGWYRGRTRHQEPQAGKDGRDLERPACTHVDERQTTCAAADILDESGTFGTKRKEILDSVSATVILDDYLAWRKEHPGEI